MAKYGSMPAGAAKHLSLHKRTVSLVLAIGAVVALTACVAFVNRGQRVGLEARVEGYLPYANMEELAANHNLWVGGHDMNPVHLVHSYREQHSGWNAAKSGQSPAADQASMKTEGGATQQQLSSAKTPFAAEAKKVETSLAQDMRKLWKAKTPAAKQADLKKVEVMKGRFEALLQAAEASPMLEVLPSRNDGLTHVVDPRTGHVYTLYEYHVPGGYEDAVLDPHPIFANDMKGLAPFADPAGRNPIYQGTYPDYDSIYPPAGAAAEEEMETRARTPTTLYEYHVPGGYEDAELEPSPLFGNDLKGLAPFTDRTGRNPIYQGEHFDYDALGTGAAEGSAAAEAVAARPQGLYEYHVPGGYEDAELEPSPLFGNDLKGLAPFTDRTGRNPIYQGEHFDYDALGTGAAEGSAAAEAVAQRPQGLYQIRGQPAQFVVADRAGQLRLVSRRSVRGMIAAERDAAANREWAMKKPEVIARKEAQVAAMKKQVRISFWRLSFSLSHAQTNTNKHTPSLPPSPPLPHFLSLSHTRAHFSAM